MKDQEFRAWLVEGGGAKSPKGRNSRVQAVRTIEENLAKIGIPYKDLDEVLEAGKFELLHQRLKEIHEDFKAEGQEFKILMPKSTNPTNRLSNWRSWIKQYERFLSGEPPGRDQYADRIREYVLREIINPARQRGEPHVDILVSDVNSALGLPDAWPSICSALTRPKLHAMAGVSPPEQIKGSGDSSAAVFRFRLQDTDSNEEIVSTDLATENDGGKKMHATNLILYGPPGTGKTYATAKEAVEICLGDAPRDRAELLNSYKKLMAEGRIEFVTFHQSMSYEDFVEGRQPMTGSGDDEDAAPTGFRLETVPGIFRRIARRAEASRGIYSGGSGVTIGDRQVFKMSIGRADIEEESQFFEEAIENGYALMGGSENIDWSDEKYSESSAILEACKEDESIPGPTTRQSGRVKHIDFFRNRLKVGDILVVSKGNSLFRAIGLVTGEYENHSHPEGYNHRRSVNWLWVDNGGLSANDIYQKNFMQQTIYKLSKSALNIPALERLISSGGADTAAQPQGFVLIIDEINRANISKVLGELITLLEPDKRLSAPNELRVRLPYSGDDFGVPANLHIIGTMNTADRSIALLDTALRRRFEFLEMMPDPSLLTTIDGVDLQLLLTKINERIEYLYDREHQIGHAYFMGCETREDIDDVMRHKVIPLLAEYFYEDWSKVAAVLGDSQEGEGAISGGFLDRTPLKAPPGLDEGEMAPRFRWEVRSTFDYGKITGQ